MKYILLTNLLLLLACASATETYTSDGRKGYALTCSGTARSWGMCYEKAGQICGAKGYDVIDKIGEGGAIATNDYASTTHTRTMTISCKEL